MKTMYRTAVLAWAPFLWLGLPPAAVSGTITFGGDVVTGTIPTPALIDAGGTFFLVLDPVGEFRGLVLTMRNNAAATAGEIAVDRFGFRSLRPAGAGGVTFTLAIDQDFAYAGAPAVAGFHDAAGAATFTGSPQRASVSSGGFIEGLGGTLPVFDGAADPAGSFPQVRDFG